MERALQKIRKLSGRRDKALKAACEEVFGALLVRGVQGALDVLRVFLCANSSLIRGQGGRPEVRCIASRATSPCFTRFRIALRRRSPLPPQGARQ